VKQYQNFDKNINGNTNRIFSVGKLRWILPIEFVIAIFIAKHQQKYFIVYIERIAVGKKRIKNPEKYDGMWLVVRTTKI
jgi:hypothetical protein